MKNRYGDEYDFVMLNDNTCTITGDLNHWRFGGIEGQRGIDDSNLGFVDPSGGPFLALGMTILDRKITRISLVNESIQFTLE